MNNIIISVIIPCYNCEKYIDKCLDSILNQLNKNIEIILIDDGSTDNSYNIAKSKLEKSNINYKILKQKNSGVSTARNNGIKNSSGKYLYFIDADDYIENTFFEDILKLLIHQEYDIVAFGFNKLKRDIILNNYSESYGYIKGVVNGEDILPDVLRYKKPIQIWSCIINRKVIKQNNLLFCTNYYYGEDREFLAKVLFHSKKVIMMNKNYYNYCIRDDSATNTFNEKRFSGLEATESLIQYILLRTSNRNLIECLKKIRVENIFNLIYSYCKYNNKLYEKEYIIKIKEILKNNKKYIKEYVPEDYYQAMIKKRLNLIKFNLYAYIFIVKFKRK
ncbi:glycosyltransferase family 2 protein [Clostridium perfringens]|nr:glycosyltransferase family 2 protein [Clostridium perfringens]MDM0922923.1 glycosyltransferase family 2 protein [Clostridium perfringens]